MPQCVNASLFIVLLFFIFYLGGGGGVKIETFSWPSFVTWLKPVLNWANDILPEHTSDAATNYDSFLN